MILAPILDLKTPVILTHSILKYILNDLLERIFRKKNFDLLIIIFDQHNIRSVSI